MKPDIVDMAKKKRHLALVEKMQQGKTLKPGELKELEQFEAQTKKAEEPAQPPLPPGVVRTQNDLAIAVRKTLRTIGYWISEGMPVNPDGTYHIATIVEWRVLRDTNKIQAGDDDQKRELEKIKTERAKFELEQLKSELIPRAQVDQENARKVLALKTSLLTLPKILAPRLFGMTEKEIHHTLTERIKDIIRVFSGEKAHGRS